MGSESTRLSEGRIVQALLVVLGYSRLMWLQFYSRQTMAVLMGGLLVATGLLLRETGLSLRHIAVVFALLSVTAMVRAQAPASAPARTS